MQTLKNKAFRVGIHMLAFNGTLLVRKLLSLRKGTLIIDRKRRLEHF